MQEEPGESFYRHLTTAYAGRADSITGNILNPQERGLDVLLPWKKADLRNGGVNEDVALVPAGEALVQADARRGDVADARCLSMLHLPAELSGALGIR